MKIKLFRAIDQDFLRAFLDKDYRDGFMQEQVRTGIAYQLQALRKKLGLTQRQMGEKIGKPQSVVSRLEDEEYGAVTVQTLLDVASSLDVALLVKFVDYPEFIHATEDMSDEAMQPETIRESVEVADRGNASGPVVHMNIRCDQRLRSFITAETVTGNVKIVDPATNASEALTFNIGSRAGYGQTAAPVKLSAYNEIFGRPQ